MKCICICHSWSSSTNQNDYNSLVKLITKNVCLKWKTILPKNYIFLYPRVELQLLFCTRFHACNIETSKKMRWRQDRDKGWLVKPLAFACTRLLKGSIHNKAFEPIHVIVATYWRAQFCNIVVVHCQMTPCGSVT